MQKMKKTLSAAMAACLLLTAAPVGAQAEPAPSATLTYAQQYQPTTRAEVLQAGAAGRPFEFVVDNGLNNNAIASVRLVVQEGVTPQSPVPIGPLGASYKNGKLYGNLSLKSEAIYPARFHISYRLQITYTDGSTEYIDGKILVEPVPALVKPRESGSSEVGRTVGIVFGVLAGLGIVAGIGALFMNAMPGAPKPPQFRV